MCRAASRSAAIGRPSSWASRTRGDRSADQFLGTRSSNVAGETETSARSPPRSRARPRESAKPKPRPGMEPSACFSPRSKALKMRVRSMAEMPGPSSETVNTAQDPSSWRWSVIVPADAPPAPAACAGSSERTLGAWPPYLQALSTRLKRMRSTVSSSVDTSSDEASSPPSKPTFRVIPACWARWRSGTVRRSSSSPARMGPLAVAADLVRFFRESRANSSTFSTMPARREASRLSVA